MGWARYFNFTIINIYLLIVQTAHFAKTCHVDEMDWVLLAPFAEAIDLTQADKTVTISCVVPTVLTLRRLLIEQQPSVTYHRSAVDELL